MGADTVGPMWVQIPELAMTTSRDVISCSAWSILTASTASVSDRLSILTRMSLLPAPMGSACRLATDSELEGFRTAAMTVLLGRER